MLNQYALLGGVMIGLLLTGCSSLSSITSSENNDDQIVERNSSTASEQQTTNSKKRQQLNYGYAQLYETADGLGWLDEGLLLKQESDTVGDYAKRLANEMKTMQQELDKLNSEIPAMQVDNNGLPEMEKRKRAMAQSERLKDLAPFIGQTGKQFERTLLLSLSGALNQTRYLIRVMAEDETVPPLKQFLDKWRQRTDQLYQRDVKILNKYYFE